MQQMDFFDLTLERKIHRLDKWIGRLQREMWFLKQVYELNQGKVKRQTIHVITDKQQDMFS